MEKDKLRELTPKEIKELATRFESIYSKKERSIGMIC